MEKKIVYSVPTKKEKFLCKLREDRCIYLFTFNFVYQQLYRIQIQQPSDIESCTWGFPTLIVIYVLDKEKSM